MNQFKQQILPLFEANREEFICQARVMGAVFATKQWERVGYTASERAHGRPIAIFRRRAA